MRRLSGFSLMEMMVVLLIVSIVAAASAPMISKKVVGSAENDSPWVWTGLNNNIAYNLDTSTSSAIIGYKHTPTEAMQPKLYIQTESGKKNPQISLGEGKDSPSVLKFLWSDNSVIMSSIKKDEITKIGKNTVAIGAATQPKGDDSIAIGYSANTAANATSIAIGSEAYSENAGISIGKKNTAAENSVVIGNKLNGSAIGAVALGSNSKLGGQNAVLVGTESNTPSANTVAIGANATSSAPKAVAIGTDISASSDFAVAMGAQATAGGNSSVAIGNNSTANGAAGIAMGYLANTNSSATAVAIGPSSNISNSSSAVAIGYNNKIENAKESIIIGTGSSSNDIGAIAIGKGINAVGKSVMIGYDVKTTGKPSHSVTIGSASTNRGKDSILLGRESNVYSDNSIAIGVAANSNGTKSIAIGRNSTGSGEASIAMGNFANALSYGISIGSQATSGSNSVAIGTKVNATGNNSLAIGSDIESTGSYSVGIGQYANATGVMTTAIGNGSKAQNSYATALGYASDASDISATALGAQAVATKPGATATGQNAKAYAQYGTAIGYGTTVYSDSDYSTAIGYGAWTRRSHQIVLGDSQTTVYIPGNLVVGKDAVFNRDDSKARIAYRITKKSGSWPASGTMISPVAHDEDEYENGHVIADENDGNSLRNKLPVDTTSDRRLKNVGENFQGGLAELKKLDLFHFTYKKDNEKTPHVGVMAQDLQKVFPNAVTKGEDGYLRIRWEDMFYALINAVKELDDKIIKLQKEEICTLKKDVAILKSQNLKNEKELTQLKKQNADLEKRLAALEKKLK